MTFKLFCNKNPAALGIENASRAWDLAKLEAHIKACRVCGRAKRALKSEIKQTPLFRHGGQRKGSGRPDMGLKRMNVMLDDVSIHKARRLGGGNLSAGLRAALKSHARKTD